MKKKELFLKRKIECVRCGQDYELIQERRWGGYREYYCWSCYRKHEFTFAWIIAGFVWLPLSIAFLIGTMFMGFDFGQGFILTAGLLALAYYICRRAYINQPYKEGKFK